MPSRDWREAIKTYDALIAKEESGSRKLDDFVGDVTSIRAGKPDGDGFNRNNFKLRRIWVNGRRGVYIKLMPHDLADQDVGISLPIHQARWLVTALQEAIAKSEEYEIKKDRERAKIRERRRNKKSSPAELE